MNLKIDFLNTTEYTSNAQIARVQTEYWVKSNIYCPSCGNERLNAFENNRPVADFYCQICLNEFELKSKDSKLGNKILDGAYSTMLNRIAAENNPNFFFLTYNKFFKTVNDFIIIPKHFFVPDLIEKRNPLAVTARRAGWIGCNILLNRIPPSGRIFIIKNSTVINKEDVLNKWKETDFLKNISIKSKGWIIDVLNCIEMIQTETFSLDDVYKFEYKLKLKYPSNNFIKDKIRQQLQLLRDKGVIEFVNRGLYKKKIMS